MHCWCIGMEICQRRQRYQSWRVSVPRLNPGDSRTFIIIQRTGRDWCWSKLRSHCCSVALAQTCSRTSRTRRECNRPLYFGRHGLASPFSHIGCIHFALHQRQGYGFQLPWVPCWIEGSPIWPTWVRSYDYPWISGGRDDDHAFRRTQFQFFWITFWWVFIQMMITNDTDRFTLAIDAIKGGAKVNQTVSAYAHEKCSMLKHLRQKEKDYIYYHGKGAVALLGSNLGWLSS